ncbi:MAG: hypothetical protein D6743_08290 [Calditrichaeota bacterium]|nr:MAG: hypothetical protein D6743_08290 [Calditrichota bacterium]
MQDPIVLGHNQFFGVNHLVAKTGNEKEAYFSDIQRIMEIIHFCYDNDVHAMMMSTHERSVLVTEAILKDAKLKKDFGVYLLVPYVAKYIKQANEKGLVNIVRDALGGTTFGEKFSMFFRGGMGLLTRDMTKMLTALIDFEVAPYRELNLRAIFLHDVMTDLVLGWDLPEVLQLFADHIRNKYHTTPAFCTKNLPRLMRLLERTDIRKPLVMASINKLGYQVSPSREAFEEALRRHDLELLAMSTLAAGYLRPREAYEYLFSLSNVESVVVGVSSTSHAEETFNEIRRQRDLAHWKANRKKEAQLA